MLNIVKFAKYAGASFIMLFGAIHSASAENCSTDNVELRIDRIQRDGNYYTLAYSISHSCSQPTGIQLQVTGYSKGGTVLFSSEFWPGGVKNIPPNTTMRDEWIERSSQSADKVDLVPIQVKAWRK